TARRCCSGTAGTAIARSRPPSASPRPASAPRWSGPAMRSARRTRRCTMHPSDAALLALTHGELSAGETASIRSHVTGCATCREREAALRNGDAQIGVLLRLLDHPVPARVSPKASVPRFGARRAALAASLAVFLAGAAAAAVPGTALNRWF